MDAVPLLFEGADDDQCSETRECESLPFLLTMPLAMSVGALPEYAERPTPFIEQEVFLVLITDSLNLGNFTVWSSTPDSGPIVILCSSPRTMEGVANVLWSFFVTRRDRGPLPSTESASDGTESGTSSLVDFDTTIYPSTLFVS